MIVITTQIQHVPGNGVSMVSAVEQVAATETEHKVVKLMEIAIQTAIEQMIRMSNGGNSVSGDRAIADLVKSRIESAGLKFEGTPIAEVLRKPREL